MRAGLFSSVAAAAVLGASGALAEENSAAPANEVEGLVVTGVHVSEPLVTKSDVPALEVPQAVSVITAERMREQGVVRLADALRNVAGVTRSSTYGFFDSYQIRGYDAAYGSIFLDGLTTASVAGAVNEMAGLEQVEVIKGPASALFGASPLGGVINLVSKRPVAERFFEVGVATGSDDLFETTVDANGPLIGDILLGRVNFVYRDGDDFVDFSHTQRVYVAPALTWNIAANTKLTLLGRYQRDRDNPWSPVTAWGTILPSIHGELPLSFSINGTGAQEAVINQTAQQIGYVFDHRFNDALSFSQTVRYERRKTYWDQWMFVAGFVDDNVVDGVQHGRVLGRYLYGPFWQTDKDFGADSRLTWRFDTGSISHQLMAGVDYRRTSEQHVNGDSNFDPAANSLDILNPDYSAPYVRDPTQAYEGSGKTRQTGFYLHDHVTLTDRLTLTLGGRWDEAKSGEQTDSKFSPHIGGTFTVADGASVYVSYSKSFTPTPSWQTDFTGALLPPETGENIEAGLKVQTLDGKLAGMASVYQLTRQNVATDDPDHPLFFVTTGEQRSRGVELEGQWRPNEAVQVTGAYAYIDAEITKDNRLPVGIPLANFPKHSLNLWGQYTVQGGVFDQLAISLGLLYNSDKHFYESAVYRLPAYTLVDFGVAYPFGEWKAQLNVNNVLDERYFPDACCIDRVTPGEPRSWRLSVRRRF